MIYSRMFLDILNIYNEIKMVRDMCGCVHLSCALKQNYYYNHYNEAQVWPQIATAFWTVSDCSLEPIQKGYQIKLIEKCEKWIIIESLEYVLRRL